MRRRLAFLILILCAICFIKSSWSLITISQEGNMPDPIIWLVNLGAYGAGCLCVGYLTGSKRGTPENAENTHNS